MHVHFLMKYVIKLIQNKQRIKEINKIIKQSNQDLGIIN